MDPKRNGKGEPRRTKENHREQQRTTENQRIPERTREKQGEPKRKTKRTTENQLSMRAGPPPAHGTNCWSQIRTPSASFLGKKHKADIQ